MPVENSMLYSCDTCSSYAQCVEEKISVSHVRRAPQSQSTSSNHTMHHYAPPPTPALSPLRLTHFTRKGCGAQWCTGLAMELRAQTHRRDIIHLIYTRYPATMLCLQPPPQPPPPERNTAIAGARTNCTHPRRGGFCIKTCAHLVRAKVYTTRMQRYISYTYLVGIYVLRELAKLSARLQPLLYSGSELEGCGRCINGKRDASQSHRGILLLCDSAAYFR